MAILQSMMKSVSEKVQRNAVRGQAAKVAEKASKKLAGVATKDAAAALKAKTAAATADTISRSALTHAQIIAGAKKPIVLRTSMFHPASPVVPTSNEGKHMLSQIWDEAKLKKAFTEQSFTKPMQDSYRTLQATLKDHPDGQLALQYLLQDKKLTIGGNNPNKSLLGALQGFVDRKATLEGPKNGINHALLLSQQAQELADVVSISQEHKGVCAATAAGQVMWAIKNPVDYTRYVLGLAADGKAKLPNGEWAKRVPDWREGTDQILADHFKPGTMSEGRSIPGQLVEPSFMQVAAGKSKIYENRRDLFVAVKDKARVVADGGLADEETQTLVSALYPGETWKVTYPTAADLKATPLKSVPDFHGKREVTTKAKMMDFLKGNASPDAPIPVGVNYQLDGGHELLVTGTSASHGNTFIEYLNPWGQMEKMHEESFSQILQSMVSGGQFGGVKV